jgi:ketosteroid isomerase-like protein
MTEKQTVNKWLADYVAAWKSYDPAAIGALFSQDAGYRFNPYDEPVKGREAIVANWLENKDKPDTYKAEYKALAVDGDTAVAGGRTQYYEDDGKTPTRQFDNIFVLQFDSEGRCTDFCEWYMQPRGQR